MTNINKTNLVIYKKTTKNKNGEILKGSAKLISDTYDIPIYTPLSCLTSRPPPTILNWGCSKISDWLADIYQSHAILNKPDSVARAVDKSYSYNTFSEAGLSTLLFTNDLYVATDWLNNHRNDKVYCRTLTRASKGRGIVIASTKEELVNAPLYTLGYPRNIEYRVHVFSDTVIDIQVKRKRTKAHLKELDLKVNPDIRNINNGYVFCRADCLRNEGMERAAIKAVKSLGLDFGAVDVLGIVESEKLVDYRICEVNTAPALEGATFNSYMVALNDYLDPNQRRRSKFIRYIEGL